MSEPEQPEPLWEEEHGPIHMRAVKHKGIVRIIVRIVARATYSVESTVSAAYYEEMTSSGIDFMKRQIELKIARACEELIQDIKLGKLGKEPIDE